MVGLYLCERKHSSWEVNGEGGRGEGGEEGGGRGGEEGGGEGRGGRGGGENSV